MKTALKLNKKELLSLYEKSSEQVKKTLEVEFGTEFFIGEKSKSLPSKSIPKDLKIADLNKGRKFFNLEAISDFTPIFRMLGYAYLLWLIL